MSAVRPLVSTALISLGLAALTAVDAVLPRPLSHDPFAMHGVIAVYGFLLPALAAFTAYAVGKLQLRPVDGRRAGLVAALWFGSTLLAALAIGFMSGVAGQVLLGAASLGLLSASGMTTGWLLKAVPKRRESVVDVARDPLTKGDDACTAHLRFAQFFLAPGVLLSLLPMVWDGVWHAAGIHLAGIHLLAAHALVSCYGLAHLWVPRLSGVPAIAAGAIKGELHSTLLAVVLLLFGFLFEVRGLIIAGGAFAFLGAFTFMGVIGANIMRNKSKTQRVTPEFAYIPWAFTAVFWLMSGVLLGIFLNVVPDTYAANAGALRFTHVHIALLGGAGQLLLALAWRIVPAGRGLPPPPFHRSKWAFYAFNIGLPLMLAGRFQDEGAGSNLFTAGLILLVAGLAASFFILERDGRRRKVAA